MEHGTRNWAEGRRHCEAKALAGLSAIAGRKTLAKAEAVSWVFPLIEGTSNHELQTSNNERQSPYPIQ
jgi:hypothetical protein